MVGDGPEKVMRGHGTHGYKSNKISSFCSLYVRHLGFSGESYSFAGNFCGQKGAIYSDVIFFFFLFVYVF